MIWLVVLALVILAFAGLSGWQQYQADRRWRRERARLEQYGERLAARNGHPHSGDVISISEVRDRQDAS